MEHGVTSPAPSQARAVLIDMESKVVQASLLEARRRRVWEFDPGSVYSENSGSGNNWARGYCQHGPAASERLRDLLRRQTERCDRLDSFLILMSVAGGTGSGVGAYVTELLREEYPHAALLNLAVWPFGSGEVIVQDYNALLTMARLQATADAVLLLSNDQLHKACAKLLHLEHITFSDINHVICHTLASILQPSVSPAHLGFGESRLAYQRNTVSALSAHLCPHGNYKLLSIKSTPQIPQRSHAYTNFRWAGLLKHLRQMLITDAAIDEGMDWSVRLESQPPLDPSPHPPPLTPPTSTHVSRSLANLLVLRGTDLAGADLSLFQEPQLYATWAPPPSCTAWYSRHPLNHYEKSCTIVSNGQGCVTLLDGLCRRAWNMFTAGAYTHQYARHGWGHEDFLEGFIAVEQVLKDYSRLGV